MPEVVSADPGGKHAGMTVVAAGVTERQGNKQGGYRIRYPPFVIGAYSCGRRVFIARSVSQYARRAAILPSASTR